MRAVELVKQHPGKTWVLEEDGRTMRPLLAQSHLDVAGTRASTRRFRRSTCRTARSRSRGRGSSRRPGTREGRVLAPFLTEGYEGFNVDDEEDWERAERLVEAGVAQLPRVEAPPYAPAS